MTKRGRVTFPLWGMPAALALLFLFSPGTAWARRGQAKPPRFPRPPRQEQAWRRNRIQQDQHQHSPKFFQNLRELPPGQQDKILRNDAQFHRLPPWQQQQIRRNLQRWNNLTPHQKQVLRQREEIVQSLPPEKRRELKTVFPEYRRLSEGQQQQVMNAFQRLRNMPPGRRQQFLNSPQFQQRFTPRQQDVLRGLDNLLPQ
ncbi:MAG: DUF3106 domain-containing protein [Terriglobia bacterium]